MFKAFESVPKTTEQQKNTKLSKIEIERESLVTCAAFENRFKLIAAGLASGRVILYNKDGNSMISSDTISVPICSILPCQNSTSFLSISSNSMLQSCINQYIPLMKNINAQIPEDKSIVAHWIYHENQIRVRAATVPFDISLFAISPSQPEYAIVVCTDGTISGFSIEDLKLTNLYIDAFKGKKISSICCQRDLVFYIAHESIERLLVSSLEISQYSKEVVTSLDVINENAATIYPDGTAKLLKKGKPSVVVNRIQDHACVYASMITSDSWVCVFRSVNGDKIMLNGKEHLSLENDFIVPNLITEYGDPFEKSSPKFSGFLTTNGKLISLDSTIPEKNIFLPGFTNPLPFFSNNSFFIVDFLENGMNIHNFNNFNYYLTNNYTTNKILTCKNSIFVIHHENEIDLIDPKSKDISVFYPLSSQPRVVQQNKFFLDIALEDGSIISMNLQNEGFAFNVIEIPKFKPNVKLWRRVLKSDDTISFVLVNKKNKIITEANQKQKQHKKLTNKKKAKGKKEIVSIEVIDSKGCVSMEGALLVIYQKQLKLKDLNKCKTLKKKNLHKTVIDYTILDFGALLVQYEDSAEIFPLPDISSDSLGKMTYPPEVTKVSIVPNSGICLFFPTCIQFYTVTEGLNTFVPLIVNECPVIAEKPIRSMLGLVSKKPPTLSETDASFKRERAAGVMSETQDIMQELLVQAKLRSEELSQMEEKSNLIAQRAKQFYENAKKMNEGFK
ncbi:hypothetical protein TRFO_13464 [Tritrichomonas foetus]|uniref:V-SNARE coiled-coil homology domain-containing protein n=1 Tax=Tritrichomonas foetus TaxID=1144522 RepID=A0A1J4KY23_9EUKA|nr:hypothetical protein TRFO_13464 [Tritrichomonas foetus]|eukprot:OHT16135.1 hypothetical protein TRFO_13464 [Tritrichomonas foetus]